MTQQKKPILPRTLVEALAGTPLTYLAPTQQLVGTIQPKNVTIPMSAMGDTEEHIEFSALRETLVTSEAQRQFMETLAINEEMEDLHIQFGTLTKSLSEYPSDLNGDSASLFVGLGGLAGELAGNLSLVDECELTKINTSKAPPTASSSTMLRSFDVNQTTVTSVQSESPAALTTSQQKREISPHTQDDVQIKKRKSDIGVQHMQVESIALNSLNDLVRTRIGITDEDSEYESSDVWIELANTDHILSDDMLMEINLLLSKIQGTSLAEAVHFDVLERIQRLIMKAIRHVPEVHFEGMCDPEQNAIYNLAHNVLRAISVLLSVFNLQRKEKKLYLDDYLADALTFLYTFVEDYVLKLENTDHLNDTLSIIKQIIDQLSAYLSVNQTNDTLITKLEYMAIMIFFHPADRSFLPFKWVSMKLLTAIFEHVPDQRSFIMDEITTNMDKLPTHKTTSRQVSLIEGVSVQLVSILILNLVNCLNLKNLTYSNELLKSTQHLHAHEKAERLKENERFLKASKQVKKERDQLCGSVASALVTKLVNNPTPSTKTVFELFLQDLLSLVGFLEFTSAESLLFEITKYLMYNSENQPVTVETHLMEMIGLVGSKMLQIRGPEDPPQRSAIERSADNATIFKVLASQRIDTVARQAPDLFFAKWVDSLITDSHSSDVFMDESTMILLNQMLVFYFTGKTTELFVSVDVATAQTTVKETYKQSLVYSNFISLYHNFLNQLLNSMDHSKIKSRTRALKNLALIIAQDDRFINIPQVKSSLSSKITDPSALVRLAVLEIFQQCITKKPWTISDFYQTVLLTNDKAVSLRKKSVELAKQMMDQSADTDIQIFALEKILRRLEDDEETVLDVTKHILIHMFACSTSRKTEAVETQQVEKLSNLILGLINRASKNWELFETFLFEDLIRVTDENRLVHNRIMDVCHKVVDVLFTTVIQTIDTENQKPVEVCLGLLSIFSKSEVPFVNQDQLLSLQPYLTSDTNGTSTTLYSLIILRNTLAHTNSLREQFLIGAQSSLLKRLTRFNTKELDQAMPSVWGLSEMRGDTSKVANAAASCLLLVRPYLDKALHDNLQETDSKILRLLYLIGSFGRYCDLESNRDVFVRQTKLGLKEKETILSLIMKTILVFTKRKVNRQVRRIAVRNMIHVATSHSKLFMSEPVLKILDLKFASNETDFKTIMIQGLLEFLEKEERDAMKKSQARKATRTVDVQIFRGDGKTFENDGICASLVQRYLEPVLELCLDKDTENSLLAVKYLRFIVKLGFANPRICIPTVIALQASHTPYIRMIGLELHKELHERHESLIDSSYIHGFKEAVRYRLKQKDDMIHGTSLFFTKFYSVIKESKTSRKRFLTQFVKSLNFSFDTITLEDSAFFKNYTAFLCPSLLECEFTTYDEVFILIEGIEFVLLAQDNTMKLAIQQLESDPTQVDKIGMISCMLLTLHRLVRCLRSAYRIPIGMEKDEVKSQKAKIHEKEVLKLPSYNNEGVGSEVFAQLFAEIV